MTNAIQVFNFEQKNVRVIMENDEPWFVGKDVCDYFGDSNHNRSLGRLDDDEKGVREMDTPGGRQALTVINEPGLYHLLFNFEPTEARGVSAEYVKDRQTIIKKFRKWVTGTVLPSIRKYGRYEIQKPQTPEAYPNNILSAKVIYETAGLKDNQLTLALDKLYRHYTGESALELSGVMLPSPVQKQILNPTEIGEELGLSANRVNKILRNAGYQRKLPNGKWEPTEKGKPYAVMLDVNKQYNDGTPVVQLKWYSPVMDIVKGLISDSTSGAK